MLVVLVVFSGVALAKVIKGTNGHDRLIGTAGFDRINGYGGNALIAIRLGADRVRAGSGRDTIGDPLYNYSYNIVFDGPNRDRSYDVIAPMLATIQSTLPIARTAET